MESLEALMFTNIKVQKTTVPTVYTGLALLNIRQHFNRINTVPNDISNLINKGSHGVDRSYIIQRM